MIFLNNFKEIKEQQENETPKFKNFLLKPWAHISAFVAYPIMHVFHFVVSAQNHSVRLWNEWEESETQNGITIVQLSFSAWWIASRWSVVCEWISTNDGKKASETKSEVRSWHRLIIVQWWALQQHFDIWHFKSCSNRIWKHMAAEKATKEIRKSWMRGI